MKVFLFFKMKFDPASEESLSVEVVHADSLWTHFGVSSTRHLYVAVASQRPWRGRGPSSGPPSRSRRSWDVSRGELKVRDVHTLSPCVTVN